MEMFQRYIIHGQHLMSLFQTAHMVCVVLEVTPRMPKALQNGINHMH